MKPAALARAGVLVVSAVAVAALGALPAATQQAPPFRVVGATFFAVQTADADAAADWYADVFGLDEVNRIDAPDGRYAIRLLTGAGLTVEVIRANGTERPPDRHTGLFKAGVWVDDVDAAHRWLTERGVDTDASVFVDEALLARSFTFRDLDGNRLQAFQRCGDDC